MLNQQTIEKLYAMRMRGMADAFTQQQEDPGTSQLGFEERFAMLVDRQWNWRQNRALERRLRDKHHTAQPAWKTSIYAPRVAWINRWSARYCTSRTGCAVTSTFS